MMQAPLLGRAMRVNNRWYTHCCGCGCTMQTAPERHFDGEPCCMRCDLAMLSLPPPPPPASDPAAAAQQGAAHSLLVPPHRLCCRFCGKPPKETGTSRFRACYAPADEGGRNALLPPPLRMVAYCPTHYRAWLETAHKTMSTQVIFAHLSARAMPLFGADVRTKRGAGGKVSLANELQLISSRTDPAQPRAAKRRRTGPRFNALH